MRTPIVVKGARAGAVLAAALLVTAGLAGCADLQRATASYGPAPVNVESPVAAAVVAAEQGPVAYPSFRDVPQKVEGRAELTPFQQRRVVQTLSRSGDDVSTWAAENPAMAPNTTDAFNTASLKALKYDPADLPPEDQGLRTEAFAQGVRAKAAPPAPPH